MIFFSLISYSKTFFISDSDGLTIAHFRISFKMNLKLFQWPEHLLLFSQPALFVFGPIKNINGLKIISPRLLFAKEYITKDKNHRICTIQLASKCCSNGIKKRAKISVQFVKKTTGTIDKNSKMKWNSTQLQAFESTQKSWWCFNTLISILLKLAIIHSQSRFWFSCPQI